MKRSAENGAFGLSREKGQDVSLEQTGQLLHQLKAGYRQQRCNNDRINEIDPEPFFKHEGDRLAISSECGTHLCEKRSLSDHPDKITYFRFHISQISNEKD